MNFYIITYFIVVFLIVYLGFLIKKNLKNISGDYYFIFSFFGAIWFLLYFIFYIIENNFLLLYLSKITFLFSIFSLYFFIKFILSLGLKKTNIINFFEFLFFIFLIIIYLSTNLIIEGISYDESLKIYVESYGTFIYFHQFLTIFLFICIIYSFYFKFKKLEYINKIRLKIIFYSFLFFLSFGILFQTILPYFGYYIFYKELIYFLLPFIFLSWYSLNKYHFSDITLRYNQILSFILSSVITVLIISFGKNLEFVNENINDFWGINSSFTYYDIIFGIIFFSIFYKLIISLLPLNKDYYKFITLLNKLKEQVIFIIDFDSLNNHLKKYVSNEFNLNYIKINLNINKGGQVFKFLDSKSKNDIFINDVVFLSENKYNFDLNLLDKEINKDAYLILPLKDKGKNIIGYFEIGKKPFGEHYYTDEILIIKDLASFLSLHLMYINMYSEINYLTINLDKEVDKKTIEYNNLINKLKEFISISSHEIKTPIMSISLQIESIIDDINNSNNDINNIKLELDTLKNQIYNISDLVKVLFNIEKYDIGKVGLYLEKVNLDNIFSNEINNLKLINPKLQINYNFNSDIYYIDLDKVQFTQVISNLLHNAVKFCNKVNPVINVTIKSFENNIKLEIEDNGNGFKNNEEDFIFEKYSTGFGKSIGLGLGLYLCKKIIDLHNGTIKALNSKKLGGALISIIIPKNQKKEK